MTPATVTLPRDSRARFKARRSLVRRRGCNPTQAGLQRFVSRDALRGSNRYSYGRNAPTIYIDPSGLAAVVHFTDGTEVSTESAAALARLIQLAGPNSISEIDIYGHGGNTSVSLTVVNGRDRSELEMFDSPQGTRFYLDERLPGGRLKRTNFLDALRGKLAPGAFINLDACNSAGTYSTNELNITQALSNALPGVQVMGVVGELGEYQNMVLSWEWGNHVVFLNGKPVRFTGYP